MLHQRLTALLRAFPHPSASSQAASRMNVQGKPKMKPALIKVLAAGAALVGAALLPLQAVHAQDYPNKPIKLIVPFAVGGTTDSIGRLLATHLTKRLGQPVIVENRAGAGSQIGIAYATKVVPDGYTLVLGGLDGLAMGPAMKKQKPYDALRELTPISLVASAPLVFTTNSKFTGKTMTDLVNLARSKPNGVTYGSAGVGSSLHLGVELLQANTGTKMLHIPYQGGAPMMKALISDEVDFVLTTPDFVSRYVAAGQAKAIAQADVKRHPLLPDTPTVAEQGMKDLIVVPWFGVLGPAKLPRTIVDRLNGELAVIMKDPAVQNQLVQLGAQADYMNTTQFHDYIATESKRWDQIIQKGQIPLLD